MARRVPETISPRRLARHRGRIAGHVSSEQMSRLRGVCPNGVTDVEVLLQFATEDGLLRVSGDVSAVVKLDCQRCREPMSLCIEARVELVAVEAGDEETRAVAAAAGLEVVEVDDDRLSLVALAEDELLLALPDYPMHEGATHDDGAGVPCTIEEIYTPRADGEHDTERAGLGSPFARLRSLLSGTAPSTDETT